MSNIEIEPNAIAKRVIEILLNNKDYDGEGRSAKTISASSISKSIRQLTFDITHPHSKNAISAAQSPASKLGSGFHYYAEHVMANPEIARHFKGLTPAGQKVPSIRQEERASKDITSNNGETWTITGKFDLVVNGQLMDWKTVGMFGFKKEDNQQKYVEQASIYRWLNPQLITKDTISILYVVKDWSYLKYLKSFENGTEYIPEGIFAKDYKLMSLEDTENMIMAKINAVENALKADNPPLCDDKTLWRERKIVYKYYKNYENKDKTGRAKNYTTLAEAEYAMSIDLKKKPTARIIISDTTSEPKACHYCRHNAICDQYRIIHGI